jgi:hypothetical protein
VAGVLLSGCSLIVPHFGEFRVEPVGGVIYTYPVPAVVVTNAALPRSSCVRLRASNIYAGFQPVAVHAKQLQVVVGNLPPVETGALVRAQGVVAVALWNNAVELELLRRTARLTTAAEGFAQPIERLPAPNLSSAAH